MKKRDGFIALISAIVISMLLIAITFSLSLSGYFARFNTLNAEFKKQSTALAEACGDMALLRLAQGTTITTPLALGIGSDTCTIFGIQANTPSAGQTTIQTKAIFQKSVTNLQIVINNASITVLSSQELPQL